MKWTLFLLLVGAVVLAAAQDLEEDNELFAEDQQDEASTAEDNSSTEEDEDDQVNLRVVRSAAAQSEGTGRVRNRGAAARGNADQQQGDRRRRGEGKACRYTKGAWSECNTATNQRSRSLTLKKGDSSCEQSKTITKKCKKGQSPIH
ncbi:uncharacterized protein LOC124192534 [Daphnia pulex]|uniref:Pleiotrophin/Midkine C-terminal domain-containing protein n=1 Tax=Daphnia pulex TaxID=6669 RepID=E9G6C0_DAPPU|nr:uncharacterized protein LOC124192534 [Daphnia pulex]EFX84909.1 hypothetical protein DAPPUDRAFT_99314 [Daphnia pulex]|eukprot:EFX84909.1 hypothetical protein DAPPUDRAFT_99314 [Daphnia pulex]